MSAANPTRADRIVVVDDDARIRDLRALPDAGRASKSCSPRDGKALNCLLTRETIDLIVLDLMLPGEGRSVDLPAPARSRDVTPIIVLTAKVETSTASSGSKSAPTSPKPFNPREAARAHPRRCCGAGRRSRRRAHRPRSR